MVGKRVIRISMFLILNVGLLWLTAILLERLDEYCSDCVYLEKSESIYDSRNKGRFIESYKVVNSKFSNKCSGQSKFKEMEFWKERTRMIPNDGSKPTEKELIVWTKNENVLEYEYRIKNGEHFENINSMWSYLEPNSNFKDTLKLGIFKLENIIVGELTYFRSN